MGPLISVIIPVYNMERYLDRCVESVLKQTYINLEIILVDDGSTDSSPQKCDAYTQKDSRVKVIHKKNGGLSSARNAGLDICSGDFVGFVDSDDYLANTMYEDLFSICRNAETVATIGADEVTDDGEEVKKDISFNHTVPGKIILHNILRHIESGSVCTRLFPAEIIKDCRFDEGKLNEDILFMISIIHRIRYAAYTSTVGYHCLHRAGSTSRHFGKAVHDMIDNSKMIRKYVEKDFPELSKEAERFEIFQHMSFLLCCPSDYNRKVDPLCGEVLHYVRRHLWAGLRNPYLTMKEKLKLIGVATAPKVMSKLIELKTARG